MKDHADETAPFDDEPESEDEATIVEEALAEVARGDFVTHVQVRRGIGTADHQGAAGPSS